MAIPRVIPVLLLRNNALVKTQQFKDPKYIGDPLNAVKIFNEKEADELIFLDISATAEKREPPFELLKEIAGECFMPLSYGGGIGELHQIREILKAGVEKVIINTKAVEDPEFIREAVKLYGSSTICVSIDVKKDLRGRYQVHTHGGKRNTKADPVIFARLMDEAGAGELMVTSIDREGTMKGFDETLIKEITSAVSMPVIAGGGCGSLSDISRIVNDCGAAAAGVGSMVVFHGRLRAVLISYPDKEELNKIFRR